MVLTIGPRRGVVVHSYTPQKVGKHLHIPVNHLIVKMSMQIVIHCYEAKNGILGHAMVTIALVKKEAKKANGNNRVPVQAKYF